MKNMLMTARTRINRIVSQHKRITARVVGVVAMMVLLLSAGGSVTIAQTLGLSTYWPTEGWQTSTPEEQGMDSAQLAEMMDYLQEHRAEFHLHSMLIIRRGYIVTDAYFYPFAPGMKHDLTSVTKSFTATLTGIAIDLGYIESVEQSVLDIFPKRTAANVDANKRAMTVEDLLTMRSGFECFPEGKTVGGGTQAEMMGSPDWVQFTLDLPMSDAPGKDFNYCNPNPHLLSAIIRKTSGLSALAFARKHLFGPLGISDVSWPSDPQGNNYGWGDLYLTPRDMAKLGFLYLHKGLWDGQQVLSPARVTDATGFRTKTHASFADYGYLWWLSSSGAYYYASGRDGQRIMVFPDQDMVVVTTGGGGRDQYGILGTLLTSYISPAVASETPLSANPNGVALLESRIQHAAAQPETRPVPPLSETARRMSGKMYAMEANPLGLTHIALTSQDEKTALLRLFSGETYQLEILIGLDDVFRFSSGYFRNPGIPAAAKGAWESDNTFVLEYDALGNIDRWEWTLSFEGDRVALQMKGIAGTDMAATIAGRLEE
ncbi:MAG: serine hydrolase [bacterium]|nr:serine hydrolase [bacterium]